MPSGVIAGTQGVEGQVWHILDQTYTPKFVNEDYFCWHAKLPAGSFVPLHTHPTQDEFIYLLAGALEFVCGGETWHAAAGDFVTLPRGIPHSIHNNGSATVECLFSVSPTRALYEYFKKIDGLADKDLMVSLAAEHEVPFIPPEG